MSDSTEVSIQQDIEYLGPDRAEKMDAYLPSAGQFPGPHPAVLLIHGGGWRISHKAAEREVSIGKDLARAGYAVFSIDYLLNVGEKDENGVLRLSRLAWPRNFYDCKTAVRFLRAKAADFNIDPERIAAMGGSAGGHLAMMLGSTMHHAAFNAEGDYTDQSNQLSCILNFYGDYDIRGRRVSPFAGASREETAANEHDASPISWINQNTPPMFITHGTADATIPVERSRLLTQHLDRLGLIYWYLELAQAPHTYDLHPKPMDIEASVLSFLDQYLGTPPRA